MVGGAGRLLTDQPVPAFASDLTSTVRALDRLKSSQGSASRTAAFGHFRTFVAGIKSPAWLASVADPSPEKWRVYRSRA